MATRPGSVWKTFSLITGQRRLLSTASSASISSVIEKPIEEELVAGDRLDLFHPTRPGQVLDGRFKTIVKLGFGGGSTVWLAENLRFKRWINASIPRYVSIKIPSLDSNAKGELDKARQIRSSDVSHDGLYFIRLPIDDFQLEEPRGTHLCLVYEVMRETVFDFQRRLPGQRFELQIFKGYILSILEALDYLHTHCRLIHTDIKDDNILVTIENEEMLHDFATWHKTHPQPNHVRPEDGRVTYLSYGDFGWFRGGRLLPKLSDFNLCFPCMPNGRGHLSPIQPHRYRAPEVFLGLPWSFQVDIWNLGLLMWNLLEDVNVFERPAGEDGEYDAHVHLAQMVSLLGDPPKEMVQREKMYRNYKLARAYYSLRGERCETMNEYWGGPFFDDDGDIFRRDLVKERSLADTVTSLSGPDKEEFLDFASGMLHWLPERRKTARELLRHSFLTSWKPEV